LGDDKENEKLIAKIQLEYTTGPSVAIAMDKTDWDIGLLYFTDQNLWFINSQKERTQVSYPDIIDLDVVKPRTSDKTTKYTKVLEADHVINIDYKTVVEDKPAIRTVQISAAKEILKALRSQMEVRLDKGKKKKKGEHKLGKNELMRRLAVMLQLQIDDDDKLKYFLGIPERDLVNLMIERNRILQKGS
jgi:hypothetical protein